MIQTATSIGLQKSRMLPAFHKQVAAGNRLSLSWVDTRGESTRTGENPGEWSDSERLVSD